MSLLNGFENTIVSALITARVDRSMNQKEFAAFMGVSQAMVSKWESGECNFTVETVSKICEKLGLCFSPIKTF